jgi:tetratricopeptide (TPR) repeat protein
MKHTLMKKLFIITLLTLHAFLFLFCSGKKENADIQETQQEQKRDTDSLENRIQVLSLQIAENPDKHELLYQRAMLYEKKNKLLLAKNDMEKLISHDSMNSDYYYYLGHLYFELTHVNGALTMLEKSLILNPENSKALLKAGMIYLVMSEHLTSFEYLNKALRVDRYDPLIHYLLAWNYLEIHDTNRALIHFQRSLEIDPDYYDSYMYMGYIYKLRKDNKAEFYYNNALRIDPAGNKALLGRANYYLSVDSLYLAIDDYKKVLIHNPDHREANYNMGYIHFLLKQYEASIQFFSTAIQVFPQYKEAYYGRGKAYLYLNNVEMALKDFKKALEIEPDYEPVLKELKKLEQ